MIPISIPTKCHRKNLLLQQKHTHLNQQKCFRGNFLLQQEISKEQMNNNS